MSASEQKLSITQLKDNVAKGVRLLRIFEHGEAVVAGLEVLENTAKEIEVRVEKLKASEAELSKARHESLAADQRMVKQAADNLRAAEKEAKDIVADANVSAQKIREAAKEEAKMSKAAALPALEAIEKKREENSKLNMELEAVVKAKKKELAEIEAAINEHKKSIEKFMKG